MTGKLLLDKLCHHKQLFNWKKCNKQLFVNIRQQTASTVIPDRSKRNKQGPRFLAFAWRYFLNWGAGREFQSTVILLNRNQTLGKQQQLEFERTTQKEVYRGPLETSATFQASRTYSELPQN